MIFVPECKIPVEFKSDPEFFEKERSGSKPNTVRTVDKKDPRFSYLKWISKRGGYGRIGHHYLISIINSVTKERFMREITDVSFYNNLVIISWYDAGRGLT